jgi:hypothetical protein
MRNVVVSPNHKFAVYRAVYTEVNAPTATRTAAQRTAFRPSTVEMTEIAGATDLK